MYENIARFLYDISASCFVECAVCGVDRTRLFVVVDEARPVNMANLSVVVTMTVGLHAATHYSKCQAPNARVREAALPACSAAFCPSHLPANSLCSLPAVLRLHGNQVYGLLNTEELLVTRRR